METVACAVRKYLIENCDDPTIDLSHEFNSIATIAYWGKKQIRPHRDQLFDDNGNFRHAQNSQKQYSPTVILAVGDTRQLKFQLMRRHKDKVKGVTKTFELAHGTLFMLHPSDEATRVREWSGETKPSFWQHFSSGLHGTDGMTLGLVLRSVTHEKEVYKDTGMLVLSEDETSFDKNKYAANISQLEEYLMDELKMKEDHTKYKSLYERMKCRFVF